MNTFKNKNILLGISGGIAAYKSLEIISLLKKNGANVKVVMTKSAMEFVTPLSFQAMSNNLVYTEMFSQNSDFSIEHISLSKWADVLLIAPATANIIGKIANGIADDLLSSVVMAFTKKIAIAPAMNVNMWKNNIVQENIKKLKINGMEILYPETGVLACGDVGEGRMKEPMDICDSIESLVFEKDLKGVNILITAGATKERIDPVRFISNESSGKMGFSIADIAQKMGANVTLIAGASKVPTPNSVERIDVVSANDMLDAVLKNVKKAQIFISVAAVADYRSEIIEESKIKKIDSYKTISLVKNNDILSTVANLKNKPFCIGFAAETENLIANAEEKLKSKKIDMIVANLVGENLVFGLDTSSVSIITKCGEITNIPQQDKKDIAFEILKLASEIYTKD